MRLALLQMRPLAGNARGNIERIERGVRDAAAHGADLLVTPELAVPGYGADAAMAGLAEPADGPLVTRLRDLSIRSGVAIVAGFAELDGGTVYNSAVCVNGNRTPVVYRKSHLYGDYERSLFEPERPGVVLTTVGDIEVGFLICYDVEFPENVRRLAQAGAELVVVPTALPASDHAEFIARRVIPVRAFENQVFVAYADHCGGDGRFVYAGLSGIAAPDGAMLAEAGATDEAVIFADIRPADYAQSAAVNTYLADLRI